MADIKLVFGIDPSSKQTIEAGLNSIMNQIQPKVKIKVDQSGYKELNKINSLIESTYKTLNQMGGSKNQNATIYSQFLTDELSKLENLRSRLMSTNGTIIDKSAFDKELDEIISKISYFRAELAKVGGDRSMRTITEDSQEYYNSLNRIQSMMNTVKGLQEKVANGKGIANAQTRAEFEQLNGELQRFSSELVGMPVDDANKKIANLQQQVTKLSGTVRSNSSIFTNFFGGLGSGIKSYLAMTLSWSRIIQTTIRELREMVSTAIELDDAFTQLQIVTGESDATMEKYAYTLADTAKDMSASVRDLTEVATVYSRLGYSLDESNVLAKYTAMIQNVGDIDPSSASDAVTAIVKAFGMGVDDIEKIMDEMVVVGNGFPISVSQIAEGMNNAASMMANAGMTFEQSVALLTSANTTVQNISKSSTAVRTIIARLRNVKSELDDAGEVWNEAKYQELVSALTRGGVDLQEASGALRNPYVVLSELAERWSSLSSDIQAAITTALAGTRQQDVFSSLMTQFGEATGAMDAMKDSAGALTDAYSIFEDSMTGHINKLKVAFEELAMTAVDSGLVNGLVDIGTKIIEGSTKVVGAIGNVTDALGGLGTAMAVVGGVGMIALIRNIDSSNEFVLYGCEPIAA